jgi:hypothetical protein
VIKLILLPLLLVYLVLVCAYAVLRAVWELGAAALDR